MDSGRTAKESAPLFPVIQPTQQSLQPKKPDVKFSSFQPAEAACNLEDYFSSEDEQLDSLSQVEAQHKKRLRDTPSTSFTETEKKRQKKQAEADVWYTDRKGDRHNLLYQRIYRLDVPSYHRCLAITHSIWEPRSTNSTDRYFSQRHVLKERSKKLRRIRFDRSARKSLESRAGVNELYIILDTTHQENDEVGAPNGEHFTCSVISAVQGTGSMNAESVEECVLRRTREFNSQLRKNPYDLSIWMRYAEYQDEAVSLTRRRVTTSSTAEKKLSILASALKYHPKSERLLCSLLQLNSVLSSAAEANEKYQSILSRLPHSLQLWKSYWVYVKSSFSEFSCEKMRGIYEGTLKGIEAGIKTRAEVVIQSEKAEEDCIESFLCGVQFDLQSGYEEKAIAKIQASLEWGFCCPENKASLSEETLHMFFRKFWESSKFPKIGEKDAKGFAAFVDSQILEPGIQTRSYTETDTPVGATAQGQPEDTGWSGWFEMDAEVEEEEAEEPEHEEVDTISEEDDNQETEAELMQELGLKLEELENVASISPQALDRFLCTEETRMHEQFLPLKPDATKEIDLDRLVLFEELQPLLFDLDEDGSKKKLLLGALRVLGLDVSPLVCSNDECLLGIGTFADTVPSEVIGQLQSIFGGAFSKRMNSWYQSHVSCGRFVVNLLEFFAVQLFQSDIRIRKLWLNTAMEVENLTDGESTKDTHVGRSILQNYKDDLNLWVAYGSVLYAHGKDKESTRVWRAVVSTMKGTAASTPSLSSSSVVSEILETSHPTVLHLHFLAFLVTSDASHMNPQFLRKDNQLSQSGVVLDDLHRRQCQVFFEAKLQEALNAAVSWSDYEWILCAIYFQALTKFEGNDIFDEKAFFRHAAQLLFDQVLVRIPERTVRQSRQCEALHEKYCAWLSKARINPKKIKLALSQSLSLFPSSVVLLTQLVEVHAKAHTLSSLLTEVKSRVLRNPTTDAITLVLLLEELRSLHSVKIPGLFERVLLLGNKEIASVPVVWRLYLDSIAHRGGEDFKRVFLRSIRACPWSKSIWMKGLELSQGRLKGNEIADYLETMKEKGVRLRTDMYEILLEEAAELE